MAKLQLTAAISDYDHVRDLALGDVAVEGIDLTLLRFDVNEIFHRFTETREWEVSELGMAKFCAMMAGDNPPIIGLPVFLSRLFRQSSIYVRRDGPVRTARDLAGRRVGVPEWAQTAVIYLRGWLMHQVGIRLDEIQWFQAGVNQPGRQERVSLRLPEGVRLTVVPDRSLSEMLLAGELDAVLSARQPQPFEDGSPAIARLYPDYRAVEEDYFRATGIFPIMHLVVLRRDVFERHPWIARNLVTAFEQAKRNSVRRVMRASPSQIPVPWGYEHAARVGRTVFGDGPHWAYGVAPNRPTLEAFVTYCHEQGVTRRLLSVEELFPMRHLSGYSI